jgi:hypothetical protein
VGRALTVLNAAVAVGCSKERVARREALAGSVGRLVGREERVAGAAVALLVPGAAVRVGEGRAVALGALGVGVAASAVNEGVEEGEALPPGPLPPPRAEAVAGGVAVGVERGVSRQGVAVAAGGEGLLANEALSRVPEADAALDGVKSALRDGEGEARGLEELDGEKVERGVGVGSRPVPVAVGLSAAVAVAARLSEAVCVADARGEADAATMESEELGDAVPAPAALCTPPGEEPVPLGVGSALPLLARSSEAEGQAVLLGEGRALLEEEGQEETLGEALALARAVADGRALREFEGL